MQQIFSDKVLSEKESQQSKRISLQIVEGAKCVSEFCKDWDDLFARAVDASPFLSRAWVSTFIEEGRIEGTPLFMLFWHGTRLVALFPLAVRKCLNAKIAEPIGSGQPSYLGILLDPDHRSVVEDIADLITSKKVLDVYCSADLSSEDLATNDLLHNLARRGYFCRQTFRNPCHYAQLACSFDEYFRRNASAKSRQNLHRRERRLFENGDVKVEHYVAEEVTDEILLRIAAIEQKSWLKKRAGAVLHQPFYQKLLLKMAQAGFARVWLMTIDGADAAFEYVFVTHGKLLFAWRAFNLKYASSVSVGQILMMHAVRDACSSGILSMDIGHGEADYKRFWAKDSYGVNRVVAGRGFRGRLIAMSYYVVWRLVEIKWLHSFYRRTRRTLHYFKQKTPSL